MSTLCSGFNPRFGWGILYLPMCFIGHVFHVVFGRHIHTSFARPASAIGRSPTPGEMQGLWPTWKKNHAKKHGEMPDKWRFPAGNLIVHGDFEKHEGGNWLTVWCYVF